MTRCLLIAGPTAAGKTALSLRAAERLDGEIINADSMQVYDGLSLVTARPDAAELAQAPHHLFGTIDPGRRYSVGDWTEAVLPLIADIRARKKTPILVGGTGLYFLALTKGLAPVPEIDAATRERVEHLIATDGLDALRIEAQRLDPVSAERIKPADRQRLQRVVEVGYATGEPLSGFHEETRPLLAAGQWQGLVIDPDRDALYDRINRRFDGMMQAGALDEVRAFSARGLDPSLPACKALGVPPLSAHLRGDMALDEAIELSKRDSRRYAKRQLTWFRNQHASWSRVDALHASEVEAQLDARLADWGT